MMHTTHLSQGVDVGPITFGTTSKLGHATLEANPFIIVTPMNLTSVVCADAIRIATCTYSICNLGVIQAGIHIETIK